ALLQDSGVSAHTTQLTRFLQRGDDALRSATLWVELDPDNAEANNTLAELLIMQRRTVEALPYLATVERTDGVANFPMVIKGYNQLDSEQQEALGLQIDALTEEFPGNARLLFTRAILYEEEQQHDKALAALDSLFKAEPNNIPGLVLEARILIEQEEKNPFTRLEKALRANPDNVQLRLQYAGLLTTTDMNAAREQFETLTTLVPGDTNLLFSLALICEEVGDTEAAQNYLLQVVRQGERANEAYFYLARMAEDLGQMDNAVVYYMAITNSEHYLPATGRIGLILTEGGQADARRRWFAQQRQTNPQLRAHLYGLEAEILAKHGLVQDAIALLDEALLELPDNLSLLYARAMLYEQGNALAAMERDLRAIIKIDPKNATALNALGYTLADQTTRYQEALDLISQALALEPDEPAILDSMGWVLFRLGRLDESLEYLLRAYTEFNDAEVAAHLAEVLWARGDTEAARNIWQDALQREPGHPILVNTLERLGIDATFNSSPSEEPDEQSP
ncbi:MAG: tetratricopeptide repeat protein, partial [Halieaceae bacterium]|nr:tetratricopeptide repeat protein [Halieaceae bacterium]